MIILSALSFLLVGCGLSSSLSHKYQVLKLQADKGDINAQSEMGDLYLFGQDNLKVNYQKASYWHKKAADQGHPTSQYNLAIMYLNGYGVEMNKEKAVEYYQKAANQGDSDSQLQLGIRYLNGEGIDQDMRLAKKWFEIAHQNGNAEAVSYVEQLKSLE